MHTALCGERQQKNIICKHFYSAASPRDSSRVSASPGVAQRNSTHRAADVKTTLKQVMLLARAREVYYAVDIVTLCTTGHLGAIMGLRAMGG